MNKDRRKKLKLLTRQQKNELEKLTAQCKAQDKTLSQTNAVLEKYRPLIETKIEKVPFTYDTISVCLTLEKCLSTHMHTELLVEHILHRLTKAMQNQFAIEIATMRLPDMLPPHIPFEISQVVELLGIYFAEAKKKKMTYHDPRSQKIISDMQPVLHQFYDFVMQHSKFSG